MYDPYQEERNLLRGNRNYGTSLYWTRRFERGSRNRFRGIVEDG